MTSVGNEEGREGGVGESASRSKIETDDRKLQLPHDKTNFHRYVAMKTVQCVYARKRWSSSVGLSIV